MPSNQNPVFVDGTTITGDGTEDKPLEAVGGGGSGTVTTTGSPAAGPLAKFSGPTSITNTDLTGDVTTAGGEVTTLATVNPDVGSFTNADITVNAKGLITAAANGSGGGGGSPGGASGDVQFNNAGAFGNLAAVAGAGTFTFSGGVLHITGAGFTFSAGAAGQAVITSNVQVQIDCFSGGNIIIGTAGGGPVKIASNSGSVGFFGAAPAGQQPTPVTLADVIAILRAFGLAA
jgi:hypothetical protein